MELTSMCPGRLNVQRVTHRGVMNLWCSVYLKRFVLVTTTLQHVCAD